MVISKQYAKRLVREGKATEQGTTWSGSKKGEGTEYVVVIRHDLQRTDHYAA